MEAASPDRMGRYGKQCLGGRHGATGREAKGTGCIKVEAARPRARENELGSGVDAWDRRGLIHVYQNLKTFSLFLEADHLELTKHPDPLRMFYHVRAGL